MKKLIIFCFLIAIAGCAHENKNKSKNSLKNKNSSGSRKKVVVRRKSSDLCENESCPGYIK